uniref:Uncharacterized protein n=1 Tax=Vespula pensylvanica TaxID=30213 RepID=A0A834P0C5_VESPE|nr:hypothetical protein H0235_008641 [Vespula pensylvanica]
MRGPFQSTSMGVVERRRTATHSVRVECQTTRRSFISSLGKESRDSRRSKTDLTRRFSTSFTSIRDEEDREIRVKKLVHGHSEEEEEEEEEKEEEEEEEEEEKEEITMTVTTFCRRKAPNPFPVWLWTFSSIDHKANTSVWL